MFMFHFMGHFMFHSLGYFMFHLMGHFVGQFVGHFMGQFVGHFLAWFGQTGFLELCLSWQTLFVRQFCNNHQYRY